MADGIYTSIYDPFELSKTQIQPVATLSMDLLSRRGLSKSVPLYRRPTDYSIHGSDCMNRTYAVSNDN